MNEWNAIFFLKIRTTTTLKLSQNDRMYKISALRERRTHYTEATQKRTGQKNKLWNIAREMSNFYENMSNVNNKLKEMPKNK